MAPVRQSDGASRRSAAVSISLQIGHQLFERNDGMARRPFTWADRSRRQPPFPNAYSDQAVAARQPAGRLRWHDFSNNVVAVGDQDGLAGGSQADIFAEFFLEDFQIDQRMPAK
jgi:hypothetical protein